MHQSLYLACLHTYLHTKFRPKTGLSILNTLSKEVGDPTLRIMPGHRSHQAQHSLLWTVLPLRADRQPKAGLCCSVCKPDLQDAYMPPGGGDLRLSAYKDDFLYPLQVPMPPSFSYYSKI